MEKYGKQHEIEDDKADPSGFLRKAREHQSKFRAEKLNLSSYDEFGNILTETDAKNGLNFYDDFDIFDEVKKNTIFSKYLYQNLLHSGHIPYNFFIPLSKDKLYFKEIFNKLIGDKITSIDLLKIEYAPQPREKYLNDRTSFDVYIEYSHIDGGKGIIGVETKYTERAYDIGFKEKHEVDNLESIYYEVTEKSNVYKKEFISKLQENNYRQIWRNHLLGESILLQDSDKYKYFTSITIYPSGNKHFQEVSKDYANFLKDEYQNKCMFITYEEYFEILSKYCTNEKYRKWIDYLKIRYIVN